MKIELYSNNIYQYLEADEIIDFEDPAISGLAEELYQKAESKIDFIQSAFEYVRDQISHSADIGEDELTCTASEVLKARHGICFTKSHLLAAILRAKSIPTGLCYQKIILDDDTDPVLVYHGLNGVYIEELNRWIRLDARGNKPGVNSQFSLEKEQLAFPIRPEKGEIDSGIIYPSPDKAVIENLRVNQTRTALWKNLPNKLAYKNER